MVCEAVEYEKIFAHTSVIEVTLSVVRLRVLFKYTISLRDEKSKCNLFEAAAFH